MKSNTQNNSKKKVFVGMSGGVDSSVSAALLKKAGYDVTGVFIKVWAPDWMPCPWKEERRDAMRVAAKLDIPFLTIDLEAEYKNSVADYMIEEYRKGRTPNPDVMCNRDIKFGAFLKKALELGADYIATGHYAQIEQVHDEKLGEYYFLKEGGDKNKDQSYFLWTLGQNELKHTLFPVGHLQKDEVRKLAQKFDLPTASKKDSQGICFLGPVDMKDFLQHYIPQNPGKVLDEKGNEIGTHEGALFYTIGERHGFVISQKTPNDTPYYIIKKDIEKNTLSVSHKFDEHTLNTSQAVILSASNINPQVLEKNKTYQARFRYRQQPQECTVEGNKIIFSQPQAGVSVGQSLVLYNYEQCLGGGIIEVVL